jgi:predicted carbohydrate-binding protein with CBM5 and CBM33 domain
MQYTSAILLSVAGLLGSVAAHGSIASPTPRQPGAAMASACGQQVEVNQASDHNGNIQGMLQVANSQSDYNAAECDIWLCKGYKWEDNEDLLQTYTAGQVVPIAFNVAAPHTGTANVSIVDTATNTVIEQLLYYPVFASTATGVTSNETLFSITIPSTLGDKCSTGGACVIQHYWNAASIDQTYESCIDFVVGGSGSSSGSSSSAVASSAVATSSAVASSVVASSAVASSSAVVTSAAASSAAGVVTSTFAPLPTTLATVVKPSTTSSVAAVQTSAAAGDDDDSCDA